jgi:hypothetical protein
MPKPVIKAKKRCCQSSPRCKRCPVVLKRLARAGLAEREGPRTYVLAAEVRKRDLRKARRS